jgi:hypothetical protein
MSIQNYQVVTTKQQVTDLQHLHTTIANYNHRIERLMNLMTIIAPKCSDLMTLYVKFLNIQLFSMHEL